MSTALPGSGETPGRSGRGPRRVLVTGISGQDGQYLAELLVAGGDRVFGFDQNLRSPLPPGVTGIEGDLRDAAAIRRAIDAARPDEVYNLAAITFVPDSWRDEGAVTAINAKAVELLGEALVATGAPVRFCQASSAEIFGPPTGKPQGEDGPLCPNSPYGESKAAAHRTVARLRDEKGLFACSAILFNHESPRRPPSFVTRKITMGAARIARGLQQELVLGNLGAGRDWGYAPEYMEAMTRIARAATPRDYVVATGRAITVGDFVRLAFERVGLDWKRHVRSDAGLQRQGEEAPRIGDPSRILADLSWKATTTVEELVAMMVDADLALLDA